MIGHNSANGKDLLAQIEKIERIEAEKKEAAAAITDVYKYLKSLGYDPKIVRKVVSRRKRTAEDIKEEEELTDLYLHACGMI